MDNKSLTIISLILAIFSFIFALTVKLKSSAKDTPPAEVVSVPAVSSEVSSDVESERPVEPEYNFYDVPLDKDIQEGIIIVCSEYGIEYELILGICSVESGFNPKALGDGGASFGLMQIQPKWWSSLMETEGITDLSDPLQNVRCGCAILNELKSKFGTEYRALQAYNTGNPNSKSGYADRVYKRISELKEV